MDDCNGLHVSKIRTKVPKVLNHNFLRVRLAKLDLLKLLESAKFVSEKNVLKCGTSIFQGFFV